MSGKHFKLFVSSVLIFSILLIGLACATTCWTYDGTDRSTCESAGTGSECSWDEWGQYCMEKGCWNYMNQNDCNSANDSGCFWKTESSMGWESMGWCEEAKSCWRYGDSSSCSNSSGCLWKNSSCQGPSGCSGFSTQSSCQDSNFGCWWDYGNYCYEPGCWDYNTRDACESGSCTWRSNAYCTEVGGNCWDYRNRTACLEGTGCAWESTGSSDVDGWCYKKGCWDYTNESSCTSVTGSKCAWTNQSNYCYEKSCWNYWNQSLCEDNLDSVQGGCEWSLSGQCSNPDCYSLENETDCNSSVGCTWDGSSCSYAGCWNYDSASSCNNATKCNWKTSSCEGASGCSDYTDYDSCYGTSQGCWWDYGNYCEERYCSDWSNTNSSACEDSTDSYGLDCTWDNYWSSCWTKWCGEYTDAESCNNSISGNCYWNNGWCNEKSCWGYSDSSSCASAGCSWDEDYGYCQQAASASCYNLNETSCNNATYNLTCKWDSWGNFCTERGCWDFMDNESCSGSNLSVQCGWTESSGGWCENSGANCWDYYTQDNCESNNCTWDGWGCSQKGCWNYWDNESCSGDSSCQWSTSSSSGWDWGWCEKRACWNWDNTDEATCVNNSYNLTCTWDGTAGGWCFGPWQNNCWEHDSYMGGDQDSCNADNESGMNCTWQAMTGWCYEAEKSFTDFNTESECLKGGWGKWNGTGCESSGGTMQNPGCWIFDNRPTECSGVKGCSYNSTGGRCTGNDQGIQCANVTSIIVNNQTNQTLCEVISMLSTCCKWKAGQCTVTYDSVCWDQMATPPVGATHCKDYNAIDSSSICQQIAGEPWYMPCKWDNTTGQCEYKEDVAKDVKNVKTKKECEFIGGTWKSENICGTDDCPYSKTWCELSTGSSTYGCDMACWACNSSSSCRESKKGYCSWTVDSTLTEGGFCDVPKAITLNGDCDKSCGSCEYYSGGSSTPSAACKSSGAGCKWDNATEKCISLKSKGCSDDCFYCFDKTKCNQDGGGAQGTCKWDEFNGMCTPASFDKEVCFDGEDNDNNGQIDCADSSCMFDPFCGGGEIANCWRYLDNATCLNDGNCSWFQDPWNQAYRCGMKGENCWIYKSNQTGCNEDTYCNWFSGSNCEINHTKADVCFQKTTQTGCQAVNGSYCVWNVDPYSPQGGWCDFAMFECGWNQTLQKSKSNCESNSLCAWNVDSWSGEGRCEPKCFARDSTGSAVYSTSIGCNAAVQGGLCEWSTGWCEPNITTVGAVNNKDCASYDSNRTACNEQPGCAWFEQFMMGGDMGPGTGGGFFGPQCGVKQDINCWDFKNQSSCNASLRSGGSNTTGDGDACRWVAEGSWSWCEPLGQHCGPAYAPFNMTTGQPQTDTTACAADPYCLVQIDQYMNNNSICVSKCFNNSLTYDSCIAINTSLETQMCTWMGSGGGGEDIFIGEGGMEMGGWCDPIGSKKAFEKMEGGAPMPLGLDPDGCGTGSDDSDLSAWIDICGFGIKETTDDYALGIGLSSMTYASACNGETLWDGTTGSGRKTIKGFWYLDTDGNTTNNCRADDGAYNGFEFKIIAKWEWSNDGLKETLSAKRCLSSNWTAANMRLNSNTKKMCQEMQGMMVTIKKADLISLPTLFSAQKTMRIYATSAGENGTSRTPADTVGQVGYYKSGSVDFKKENCEAIGNVDIDGDGFYAYEDPDCKYIYMAEDRGMKSSEDCTNRIDDDRDGRLDCNDHECKNEAVCNGTLSLNSSDHDAPEIKEIDEREHKSSAEIVVKTEERSNVTLLFYYNDSSGTLLNQTIRAKGMQKSNFSNERERYGFNNIIDINNMTGNKDQLNYSLPNGTTFFYRVKVCDISGNCAKTGLMNFTTRNTTETTAVKITDPDSGESWQIDKGTGNYAEIGLGCSGNRGSNSTLGDVVNPDNVGEINLKMDMNNSAGNNIEVRIEGIETGSDLITPAADIDHGTFTGALSGVTEDYVWMNESGWGGDSGIQTNGHPDSLVIKLPGADTELWDCEEMVSGAPVNCSNITSHSSRYYNSTGDYTEWTIYNPTTEMFSYVYAQTPAVATTTTTPSSGGGGGGGGTPTTGKTYVVTEEQFRAGYAKIIGAGDKMRFAIQTENHYVTLNSLTATTVTVEVSSTPQIATLGIGETKKFEVTNDSYYDVSVTLDSINSSSTGAELTIKSIYEEIPQEQDVEQPEQTAEKPSAEKQETPVAITEDGKFPSWLIIIIIIVIAIAVVIFLILKKRK